MSSRVRANAGGTRVDVRSASHNGKYDFGTNARRVCALLDDNEDAAASGSGEAVDNRL